MLLQFDIPEGRATLSLKQFARQARLSIVYDARSVEDVRTNGVVGLLEPVEALRRLLAGTLLHFDQDQQTGAIAVKRMPGFPASAAPGASEDQTDPMNDARVPTSTGVSTAPRKRALISMIAGFLGLAGTASSQTTDQPATAASDDEIVMLSPFELNTTRDVGFVASESLAGGRLSMDLRDTAAPYSVLTKEFIDAIGITDSKGALDWAVNTVLINDATPWDRAYGGIANNSTRGVTNFFTQRNFFPSYAVFDFFNVERMDTGRGPNAILFGFASAGGTHSIVSKRPSANRDVAETSLTLNSWGKVRLTADLNRRVTDKLAIRATGLYEQSGGWRDFEWREVKGMGLSVNWQPFPNTDVAVGYERALEKGGLPLQFGIEHISGWDGTTVYSSRQDTPSNAVAAGLITMGRVSNNTPFFVMVPSFSRDGIYNAMGTGRTWHHSGGRIGGQTYVGPNIYTARPTDPKGGQYVDAVVDRYARVRTGSPSFRNIDETFGQGALDDPTSLWDYSVWDASIRHRIGENLYLEAAGNYYSDSRDNWLLNAGMYIAFIDVNRYLDGTTPNPRFGEPYNQGRMVYSVNDYEAKNFRLSAAYLLDAGGLGSWTFNLTAARWDYFRHLGQRFMAVKRPEIDPALWAFDASSYVEYRYYWSDKSRPLLNNATATYTDATGMQRTAPIGRVYRPSFDDSKVTDYLQAAARGRLFNEKLSLLAAVRFDDLSRERLLPAHQWDYRNRNWDGETAYYNPLAPSKEYWQGLTYKRRDASGNPFGPEIVAARRPRFATGQPDPLYTNDVFQDDFSGAPISQRMTSYNVGGVYHLTDHVSLAANYSEGADFNDAFLRWTGEAFGQRESSCVDFALRFSLMNNKLNLGLVRFSGREEAEAVSDGGFFGNVNTILQANKIEDTDPGTPVASPDDNNSLGIPLLLGTGWDVRNREFEGWEIEITANPSPALRLTGSIAFNDAVQVDANADARSYWAGNQADLKAVLQDAAIIVNASGNAEFAAGVPGNDPRRPSNGEHQSALNSYNALVTRVAGYTPDAQPLPFSTRTVGKLFADYTLQSGPVKGLRVGAGLQYVGRTVLGNRGADRIVDPANPNNSVDDPDFGPYDAVYRDPYTVANLTFGYQYKLNEKVTLMFRLNVDNLLDYDKPIYTNVDQVTRTGSLTDSSRVTVPGNYLTWVPPRSYSLNITAKF